MGPWQTRSSVQSDKRLRGRAWGLVLSMAPLVGAVILGLQSFVGLPTALGQQADKGVGEQAPRAQVEKRVGRLIRARAIGPAQTSIGSPARESRLAVA